MSVVGDKGWTEGTTDGQWGWVPVLNKVLCPPLALTQHNCVNQRQSAAEGYAIIIFVKQCVFCKVCGVPAEAAEGMRPLQTWGADTLLEMEK